MTSVTPLRPIAAFFARFPQFDYDETKAPTIEFGRLARANHWTDGTLAQRKQEFQTAMVQQFNQIYGTDERDIGAWQALCARLGVEEVPETLTGCRQLVMSTHVNLVDLTQAVDPTTNVRIFSSVQELRKYTIKQKKVFPKNNLQAGSVLRRLLRQIFPRR